MARKKYKRTNNDLQNIHITLKIELHEPHLKLRMNYDAPKGHQFLLDLWHPLINFALNIVI